MWICLNWSVYMHLVHSELKAPSENQWMWKRAALDRALLKFCRIVTITNRSTAVVVGYRFFFFLILSFLRYFVVCHYLIPVLTFEWHFCVSLFIYIFSLCWYSVYIPYIKVSVCVCLCNLTPATNCFREHSSYHITTIQHHLTKDTERERALFVIVNAWKRINVLEMNIEHMFSMSSNSRWMSVLCNFLFCYW